MTTWFTIFAHSPYPGMLLELLLESLMILAVAAASSLIWRRAAAATRHLVWFLAVASLPVLLCLSALPHFWPKPLWAMSTDLRSGNEVSLTLALIPQAHSLAVPPAAVATTGGGPNNGLRSSLSNRQFAASLNTKWIASLLCFWAAGTALGLGYVAMGHIRLRKLFRGSTQVDDQNWERLAREVGEALRLRRTVALRQSNENLMPVTWGWRKPIVLLPAEAAGWPEQRCRLVLLHEMAHVKRLDYLTHSMAQIVCALFWLNPLVWLAARRMRVERERACDDLVLNNNCKASDYASELVAIARSFPPAHFAAGIAMARSAQLQGRIAAMVDPSRARRLSPRAAVIITASMSALVGCLGGTSQPLVAEPPESAELRQEQIARLESFSAAKEKQSQQLAAQAGDSMSPEFQRCFDAAVDGDVQTVTNRYEYFKQHHGQYGRDTNGVALPHTACWQPVLEICLAYDHVANCEPKYTKLVVDGIINSIPPGSIYFGGTDPGRGLPTAFENSSIAADPFFCLTQNALADGSYLDYLRAMYGAKIYTPTANDSQRCFNEYLGDSQKRLQHDTQFPKEPKQIKPGEDLRMVGDQIEVSGQIAVMSINGLLTKMIFDRNPDREFYIEESFPLEWMYSYLEPHGLIMKVNRQPQTDLQEDVITRDDEYWRQVVAGALGNWLDEQTPVSDVVGFVKRVYVQKNLQGFTGDPLYIQNDYAKLLLSKLRSSIGGIYAWRLGTNTPAQFQPKTEAARQRLVQQTDLTFRQAFALCPYSPEVVFRYVQFLLQYNRVEDARLITRAALELPGSRVSSRGQFEGLLQNLNTMK